MMTAQHLYEGIEISGQTVGLITYMRTDSFNVSKLLQEQTKNLSAKNTAPRSCRPNSPFTKAK